MSPQSRTSVSRRSESSRCEVLAGRTVAACVHPLAAWSCARRSFRVLLVAGYVAAGYVAALTAMVLMN
ncbi:MAG: hypothetical protein ACRD3C_24450 [Vicinamibacterales bacterium]